MDEAKKFGLFEMMAGVLLWGIIFITSKILLPMLPLFIMVSGLLTWLKKSAGRYLNLIGFTFILILSIFQTVLILIAVISPASVAKFAPKGQLVSLRHLPVPLLTIFVSLCVIYFFTRPKTKEQFK